MQDSEQVIAVRARIAGRVQGVGYRAWTVGTAEKLGLNGWVRNRLDDTVEALFAGKKSVVEQMINECHAGPFAARVASVSVEEAAGVVDAGFRQLPTV